MKSPRHTPQQFWSHLQRSNIISADDEYSDEKLESLIDSVSDFTHPITQAFNPYMLEINIGNTCDMKCIYCNHHYSSQWGTELIKWKEITEERMNEEFPKAPSNFDSAFWNWFNEIGRYSLNKIGIIGGEPLITPEFYVLLDNLAKSVADIQHLRDKKLSLWIVTNMNAPNNYLLKFIENLPKISEIFDVNIYVSAESTEARAEYIRFGVNWKKFTNNIHTVLSLRREKNLSFKFNFMPTVNILSIVGKKDFVRFVESLMREYDIPIGITQNIVSLPDWQSPMILTPSFASFLEETCEYMRSVTDLPVVDDKLATWHGYADFLEKLANSIKNNTDDVSTRRKKFKEWFDTNDYRRNINLRNTFPEYNDFYNLCSEI
jgi:organic radical activating enzyme